MLADDTGSAYRGLLRGALNAVLMLAIWIRLQMSS